MVRHFWHLRLPPWVFGQACPLWLVGSRSSPSPAKSRSHHNRSSSVLCPALQMPPPATPWMVWICPGSGTPADFWTLLCTVFSGTWPLTPQQTCPSAQTELPLLLLSFYCCFKFTLRQKSRMVVTSGISIILFDTLCLKTFLFVFFPIFYLFSREK